MTIISIAAFQKGKNGQIYFSRQFVPIQRSRLDALLYAFPKLHHLHTHEQSFIDTDTVRYVFLPANDVNYVLITNHQSNLVIDTTILQLVSNLVYNICFPDSTSRDQELSYESFKPNLFDIFFALDEVVEYGGYPAELNMTVESIQTTLLMNSHEEHRYALQQAGKMKEAKLKGAQKAAELDRDRKFGPSPNADPSLAGRIVGMGSSSIQNNQDRSVGNDDEYVGDDTPTQSHQPSSSSSLTRTQPNLGFDGSKLQFSSQTPAPSGVVSVSKAIGTVTAGGAKTLIGKRKLGGKGKIVLGKKAVEEEGAAEVAAVSSDRAHVNAQEEVVLPQQQPQTVTPKTLLNIDQPHVKIEEKILIQIDADNTLLQFAVNGKLSLILPENVKSPNFAVQVTPISNNFSNLLKTQTRPGLDKTQWASNSILYNTDSDKPLSYGSSDKPNLLLQWKMLINGSNLNMLLSSPTSASSSPSPIEQILPFQFTHWVSSNSPGTTNVSIECTPNQAYIDLPSSSALQNIIIAIPCPGKPVITQVDTPWKFDQNLRLLYWSLGSLSTVSNQITATPSFTHSTIEFELQNSNGEGEFEQDSFLPLSVSIQPQRSYVGISPVRLYDTLTSQPVEFGTITEVTVDSFRVTNGQ